jgi:hypothetical protein
MPRRKSPYERFALPSFEQEMLRRERERQMRLHEQAEAWKRAGLAWPHPALGTDEGDRILADFLQEGPPVPQPPVLPVPEGFCDVCGFELTPAPPEHGMAPHALWCSYCGEC